MLVAEARSSCSTSITRSPRPAASRAIPAPLMPPPITSRSNAAVLLMAVPSPERPPHHAEGRLRIGNDTVAHPGERVVEPRGEGLEMLADVELRADELQAARAVQEDLLVGIADR